MVGPGSASASSSHKPMDLPRTIRPRQASNATSQSETAAILRAPAPAARSISSRTSVERSELPATSQSHTWVSSRSGSRSDVLFVTGPSRVFDRVDDVTADFDAPRHPTEKTDRFRFHRHELGDRFAPLGDDDRPALLRHLVHQPQTIGFELGCGNVPTVVHIFYP